MEALDSTKKANKKALTEYLRNYKLIKMQITELERDVAESGMAITTDGLPHTRSLKSPTERKAIRLGEISELAFCRKVAAAIESVMCRLNTDQSTILEYYFFRNLHHLVIAEKTRIAKSQIYDRADEILEMLGEELRLPV